MGRHTRGHLAKRTRHPAAATTLACRPDSLEQHHKGHLGRPLHAVIEQNIASTSPATLFDPILAEPLDLAGRRVFRTRAQGRRSKRTQPRRGWRPCKHMERSGFLWLRSWSWSRTGDTRHKAKGGIEESDDTRSSCCQRQKVRFTSECFD